MVEKERIGKHARRDKKNSVSRLLVAFKSLALFSLCAIGGVFLGYQAYHKALKSSAFRLEEVIVQGNRMLSKGEVLSLSGIDTGRNIFKVDLEGVKVRLLANPLVRKVTVSRRLPSGLLISIEERKPVALINAGSLYGVDGEGVLLPPFKPMVMHDLPIITGVEVEQTQFGQRLESDRLDRALELLGKMARLAPGLIGRISEMDVSDHRNLVLYTAKDGAQVRMGDGRNLGKIAALEVVLEDLEKKSIVAEYIDLRFKDQVVVKPRG